MNNINNGIMFENQGPLMSGKWYNPITGDSFTVKDSFFENGQYLVMTTDGRILGYDVIQNYLKSEGGKNNKLPDAVLKEISEDNIILNEDTKLINNMTQTINLGNLHISNKSVEEPILSDYTIIDKALKKYSKPDIITNIIWDNFPKRQIEMLCDVMEIDMKEIVEWYARQLDTELVATSIHNSIVQYINDQIYIKELETEQGTQINKEDVEQLPDKSNKTTTKIPKKITPNKTITKIPKK